MTRCISVASFSGVVPETRNACLAEYDNSMTDLIGTLPYIREPENKNPKAKTKTIEEQRIEAVEKFKNMT